MVALAEPAEIGNLFPYAGLRYMRPTIAPEWAYEPIAIPLEKLTPYFDGDHPSECPSVSNALGQGFRPIPRDIALAWSEAW